MVGAVHGCGHVAYGQRREVPGVRRAAGRGSWRSAAGRDLCAGAGLADRVAHAAHARAFEAGQHRVTAGDHRISTSRRWPSVTHRWLEWAKVSIPSA